ncbi:lipoyl domain-containing protein [Halobacterium yunchengense]|uniref:lipoyl domain-containing protein n=1 Tax=Halobacterium yunchengense TaxID=3108497 RepID=UPI00300951A7
MTVTIDSAAVWPEDADDVEEGVVANWFVREGASVEAGETVCEIQIEKVSVDVPAPAGGTLAERAVPENGEFRRGDALGTIEEA